MSSRFGGYSGIDMVPQTFDLGSGVTLYKVNVTLVQEHSLEYQTSSTAEPIAARWSAFLPGGNRFQTAVRIGIEVEGVSDRDSHSNAIFTMNGIGFLMRLRGGQEACLRLLSPLHLTEDNLRTFDARFVALHPAHQTINAAETAAYVLSGDDLFWIQSNRIRYMELANKSAEFGLLCRAYESALGIGSVSILGLPLLWAGLEGMFAPGKAELRFRVSANIASFLEGPGPDRMALQKSIAKLYDARSEVVHGALARETHERTMRDFDCLHGTYEIVRRVLAKMIEAGQVPSREDLDKLLFVAQP